MRSTRSVVLPVPAPASSTKLVPCSSRARRRTSSSAGTKGLVTAAFYEAGDRSSEIAEARVLLDPAVGPLEPPPDLQQRLGPAHRGEIAPVAGRGLLDEDAGGDLVHEGAQHGA